MASRIIARLYHFAKGSTPLTDLPAAWQSGVDAALKEIEKSVDPKFVQAEIKDTMEAPLKELERLNKLVSNEPPMGKSKTPAIQDSLDSLLQTLHVQKKRLAAGLATEAELTMLARNVEATKEIDERQKGIYNSLARYGKTLDKVGLWLKMWDNS
ncbi:hypothetical protein DXG03_006468 [Asterophora parasitica]|uniref:Uncharacterized protein n=1 Tax=Asterophora parasitica TaxID=117018 RepID=A0A9P7G532_9AGAR|nr:hypothetical protein DXG03_006468 [Asterophora parasitica]